MVQDGLLQSRAFSLLNKVLDALYPPACVICDTGGFWCCEACIRLIRFSSPEHFFEGIDRFYCIGSYADPVLRKILHAYKYQTGLCLESSLQNLVERWFIQSAPLLPDISVIVPVPTDRARIDKRGFDHALHLANIVQKTLLGTSVQPLLERTRPTYANNELDSDELRKGNLFNAIKITQPSPEAVLLVDDIATSGSTLIESAKVLREGGAKRVYALVIAARQY